MRFTFVENPHGIEQLHRKRLGSAVMQVFSNDRPTMIPRTWSTRCSTLLATLVFAPFLVACGSARETPGPRILQPGAPGQSTRQLSAEEARSAGSTPITQADVSFMQGMIGHHAQALTMSRLVPERAESSEVLLLARRIERSQGDEIALMERWLRARGEEVPDPGQGYRMPSTGTLLMMPGMLSDRELNELRAASGAEFDRLFLVYMIRHHEGALTMVRELFESEGAGQEGQIFEFAVEIDSDQRIEIARMVRMLTGDPRGP